MGDRRRICLLQGEKDDLIKAAVEIFSEYPLISPLDLFIKSQKVLASERRRDLSALKKHQDQYKWLYDTVFNMRKEKSQPAEKPAASHTRGAGKSLVKSVDLEQIFGSKTDEELIREFVRHMAPGPEESTETRFQLIEDRLQGIEHLLGTLTGAMRQVLVQKKATKET